MDTKEKHSKWSFLEVTVIVLAWVITIALLYTVLVKLRILIKH